MKEQLQGNGMQFAGREGESSQPDISQGSDSSIAEAAPQIRLRQLFHWSSLPSKVHSQSKMFWSGGKRMEASKAGRCHVYKTSPCHLARLGFPPLGTGKLIFLPMNSLHSCAVDKPSLSKELLRATQSALKHQTTPGTETQTG